MNKYDYFDLYFYCFDSYLMEDSLKIFYLSESFKKFNILLNLKLKN